MATKSAPKTKTAGKQGSGHHVLVLPLAVNSRERMIIEKRVRVTMKLANAILGDLMGRVIAMKRDPGYRAACELPPGRRRSRQFKLLREKHRVPAGKNDAVLIAMKHWRSTSRKRRREAPVDSARARQGWMTDVIASRVAIAMGPAIWVGVREWMLGRRGKPRFKSTRHLDRAVWNADNKSGLTFDPDAGVVRWNHPSGGAKHPQSLKLKTKLRPGQKQWLKRVAARRIVSVAVKLDGPFVFALLRVEGTPYRDPEYLDLVRGSSARVVGIDPAPTHPAISTQAESLTLDLLGQEQLAAAKVRAAWIARQQRKQDRSDRAMNPDCFDEASRAIRGKRRKHSKTWERRRRRIAAEQRRAAMERKRTTTTLVREVTRRGGQVVIEKNSVRSWQAGLKLGARVALTRPGQFSTALKHEIELLAKHGIATTHRELPTHHFPLTSQCICGKKTRWDLGDRVITCPHCGLGPVGRDAFSAFKARLIGETGIATLDDGDLSTEDFRAQALEHCAINLPAVNVMAGAAKDGQRTRDARDVPCQNGKPPTLSGELAQTVSDLDSNNTVRPARRSQDKRGNTRTHTDSAKRSGRARTSREATQKGPTTTRWLSP